MNKNLLCSWSGGKDSYFALMKALQKGYLPKVLLNVLNEEGKISRSHGIPFSILQKQAFAANLPLHFIRSSWRQYEKHFTAALKELKQTYQLTHSVFGDIDLQSHRDWEENVCADAKLIALLPLWKQDRRTLVNEMLDSRIETMIVSCNEKMGETFIGQTLTSKLMDEMESMGIDACGENGEYHTLVLNGPLFKERITADVKGVLQHGNYFFAKFTN